jgi:threonine dehydrogenase-like Zn-dependent dehydrogenase
LIEDGKIDTSPWITHRAPLEAVPERFTDWLNPASGVLKAVVSIGD